MTVPAIDWLDQITELGLHLGEEVQVWPLVCRGESRDTEPGLQPWKATLKRVSVVPGELGEPPTVKAVVAQDGYDERDVPFDMIRFLHKL
jgi:hypothetical protein